MNIKRIAWESRAVEHRTVPADQRMAAVAPPSPQAAAAKASAASASGNPAVIPDRRFIANVVEKVLSARGIPRGAAMARPAAPSAAARPSAAEVATSAVSAIFERLSQGYPSTSGASTAPAATADAKAAAATAGSPTSGSVGKSSAQVAPAGATLPASVAAPALKVPDFVSENDVRMAITRSEKIFISTQTIVTPSARDLASSHEVFVETASAPSARPRPTRD
jgi:hypothetical protein